MAVYVPAMTASLGHALSLVGVMSGREHRQDLFARRLS
jgi:hypothetical protein